MGLHKRSPGYRKESSELNQRVDYRLLEIDLLSIAMSIFRLRTIAMNPATRMKTYSLDVSGKPLRHRCARRLGARRRGNVVVLVALMMVPLFAMLAFAIDIGYMLHVRTELQRSAETCALAAATHLPDEAAASQAALQAAKNGSVKGIEDGTDPG